MKNAATAIPLGVALLCTGCQGDDCVYQGGCPPEVLLWTRLRKPIDQPVHLTVRVCRNGLCGDGKIGFDSGYPGRPISRDVSGHTQWFLYLSDGSFAADRGSEVGDRWRLDIEYGTVLKSLARDGDIIDVTVGDDDPSAAGTYGSTNLHVLAEYRELQKGCMDCATVTYEFPPP